MSAEALLARLDKPKRTGPETWLARCPAHEDRSPSLNIRDGADGRVLVICRAGCGTGDVLAAVGLGFDALFPPKALGDRLPPMRRPFPAADVLEAVMHDALVVQQIAQSVARDAKVNPEQLALLNRATARILAARDCVNG